MPDRIDSARTRCPVDRLAWYANRTLAAADRAAVTAHLAGCPACRADVAAWDALGQTLGAVRALTPAPRADLFARIEQRIDRAAAAPPRAAGPLLAAGRLAGQVAAAHVAAQVRLIRRDLFWMPLLLVPLTVVLACFPQAGAEAPETVAMLATLVAALGIAFLYGQEVDPARELVLVTPTSPRLVLAIRCGLVFGYDLLLNWGLAIPFLAGLGVITPDWFVANWLAPLACLSAVALLLSVTVNPAAAVAACVLLWGLRLLAQMDLLGDLPGPRSYEGLWHQTPLLFVAAGLAVVLAFALLERGERFA